MIFKSIKSTSINLANRIIAVFLCKYHMGTQLIIKENSESQRQLQYSYKNPRKKATRAQVLKNTID